MKKKTAVIIYITMFVLTLSALGVITLYAKMAPADSYIEKDHETTLTRESEFVSTVPGTTGEMLSYKYWADKTEEKELFTPQEIQSFNENNPSFVKYTVGRTSWKNKLFMYDLPETIDGKIIGALIESMYKKDFVDKTPEIYVGGKEMQEGYIEELIDNAALDQVPENVTPRYAININRTVAKIFPTQEYASETPEDVYFDSFISAEVMPYEGVVVFHESRDGEYSYILIGSYLGWVKTDNLAICSSKEEWLSYCRPEDFLVVTGSEIVLDETAVDSPSSGVILPMGTKLRLSKDSENQVNGRSTYGCYVVGIPARGEGGMLVEAKALLPISKDVNVGDLPMTSTKVLEQAFKFLGRIYGYGGSLCSNDCSGYIRQVYACFGLELPRNAMGIAEMADLGSIDVSKMTLDAKKKMLSETTPGMPMYMNGHLMLYLGMENGEPYVISSCATFIEPGNTNGDIVDAYCVFVSDMNLLRKNGNTWLGDISFIMNKEY